MTRTISLHNTSLMTAAGTCHVLTLLPSCRATTTEPTPLKSRWIVKVPQCGGLADGRTSKWRCLGGRRPCARVVNKAHGICLPVRQPTRYSPLKWPCLHLPKTVIVIEERGRWEIIPRNWKGKRREGNTQETRSIRSKRLLHSYIHMLPQICLYRERIFKVGGHWQQWSSPVAVQPIRSKSKLVSNAGIG